MKASIFLHNNNLLPESVDMDAIVKLILREMDAAVKGEASSLSMLNSRLRADYPRQKQGTLCSNASAPEAVVHDADVAKKAAFSGDNTEGKTVLAIDAGGTNFRACLVNFKPDGGYETSGLTATKMPGTDTEVSAEAFYSEVSQRIRSLVEKADRIGFCFSYPAITFENVTGVDGIPIKLTKEIKAGGIIGKPLGENIFRCLAESGIDMSRKKMVILNDTVATLLAAVPQAAKSGADEALGFILGTGTNCAHTENGWVINQESGGLDLSLGQLDSDFFQTTAQPETQKFEKMISGGYIGPFVLFVLSRAVLEGVFSEEFTLPERISTADVGSFLLSEPGCMFGSAAEADKRAAAEICTSVTARSARLAACMLAASAIRSLKVSDSVPNAGNGANTDSLMLDTTKNQAPRKIIINADGTTFYKLPKLREKTIDALTKFLSRYNINPEFIHIEDSPTIGAAVAALTI